MSKTFLTATLLGLLTISAASAQNRSKLEANIPFDFTVGHEMMEAGTYRIAVNPVNNLLVIQGRDAHLGTAFVLAVPGGASTESAGKLLFDCYGGACALATVLPAAQNGRSLQLSQPARLPQIAMQRRVVPLLLAEK